MKIIGIRKAQFGAKTLVYDDKTNSFYLVSTVATGAILLGFPDETLIFTSNSKGEISSPCAVWEQSPGDHDKVLQMFLNNELVLDNKVHKNKSN